MSLISAPGFYNTTSEIFVKKLSPISALAIVAAAGFPIAASAQDRANEAAQNNQISALSGEMEELQEQLNQLNARMSQLQGELEQERNRNAVGAVAAAAVAASDSGTKISWKGAPKIENKEQGWSFQPFGRLQYDAGVVNAPSSTGGDTGFGSEARRARIGVKGDMPGGFGYKFEVDFAGGAEITDAIVTYKDGGLSVAVGQQNSFQSIEELTSSRFTSLLERAAFTDAFDFKRRVGITAQYGTGDVLLQGGVFTDNIDALPNQNWGTGGRIVFAPKSGSTQLHFAGSVNYSDLAGTGATLRYRNRPQMHFTSTRFVNTGNFSAQSETGYGLEGAVIHGPFHAVGEAYWQQVSRPQGLADPLFFGGYIEAGMFLTPGDTRGYEDGKFERVKPHNPVGKGGYGAVQLVGRYDYLDLNDAGITGGKQDAFGLGLIWTPTAYTRFMLNYEYLKYVDAALPMANGDRSYNADAFAVRAQIDF